MSCRLMGKISVRLRKRKSLRIRCLWVMIVRLRLNSSRF